MEATFWRILPKLKFTNKQLVTLLESTHIGQENGSNCLAHPTKSRIKNIQLVPLLESANIGLG